MKPREITHMTTLPHHLTLLAMALLCATDCHAGWLSDPLDNPREIFLFADANGSNNICSSERDRLRIAFRQRNDLRQLDTNGNGRLDREEIDALERHQSRKRDKPRKHARGR